MSKNPVLPPIENSSSDSLLSTTEAGTSSIDAVMPPSSKEYMIGYGVLFVLAVIFFLIRNAYANYLVGSLKRSPNNGGLAAWFLFGSLLFASAIGCAALISKSMLTLVLVLPLALFSLICFIFCVVISSRK
jgi:hypothetical protein